MKLALISDIHSNFEALSAVLDEIQRRAIDEIICLGDIIGYGPDPVQCLEVVRDRNIVCLLGNHDVAAFDPGQRATFTRLARAAIEWTAPILQQPHIAFLRSLPYAVKRHGCTFVHAAPLDPEAFEYILNDFSASRHFGGFTTPICFIGHTHQPDIFCEDMTTRTVQRGMRFIVNAGSIGQPRDGDPRACFGVFDADAFTFEHVRVPYDISTTAQKIMAAGLPRQLAERLSVGR